MPRVWLSVRVRVRVRVRLRVRVRVRVTAARPHGVQDVLRQAEGHALGRLEVEPVVEEAAEVDVHDRAGGAVDEDVLEVAVAEAHPRCARVERS